MRSWAATVVAALAAACRTVAPPPPPASIIPAYEVRQADLLNGFVTVRLEASHTPAGPRAVVISAAPQEREALLSEGVMLATFQVHWEQLRPFAPPRPPEQPTYGKWLLASTDPRTIGRGYFSAISYDAETAVPGVIDWLVTQADVDPTRIGIAGRSTAGFVALQALATEPRLSAATVMVACGDYHRFLEFSNLAMDGNAVPLDPAYEAWLRLHEPIRHPSRLVHAALLMVNGADDPAIPLPCVEETVRVFRLAYARAGVPERFRSVLLPGQGHNLDERAPHEVLAWWYRWFLRGGGRA